jgi:hypothetical protein
MGAVHDDIKKAKNDVKKNMAGTSLTLSPNQTTHKRDSRDLRSSSPPNKSLPSYQDYAEVKHQVYNVTPLISTSNVREALATFFSHVANGEVPSKFEHFQHQTYLVALEKTQRQEKAQTPRSAISHQAHCSHCCTLRTLQSSENTSYPSILQSE